MNRQKLSNIPLKDFRTFLFEIGCNRIRTEGGHEVWIKEGLTRPVVLQTHIEPIPEFIVQNTLRNLGITKKQYFEKTSKLKNK